MCIALQKDTFARSTRREKSAERNRHIHWKEKTMKELVTYIARSLVDKPDEVSVAEVEGNQTTVLELTVAKEDLGKVIGKQGRTAQAIRTILSAVSSKVRKRTVLEIIE
jgi:predicted RNA-binding protein YlqC (UPF0109 family)